MLLADGFGVLLLAVLVSLVPVFRWAAAPALLAYKVGRRVERIRQRAPAG